MQDKLGYFAVQMIKLWQKDRARSNLMLQLVGRGKGDTVMGKPDTVKKALKRVTEVQMLLCSAKYASEAGEFQTLLTDQKVDVNFRWYTIRNGTKQQTSYKSRPPIPTSLFPICKIYLDFYLTHSP